MNDDLRAQFVRAAMARAGSPPAAAAVVAAVAEASEPQEYVLEVAVTTATGNLTACVVTTHRVFVGEQPGVLAVIDLDSLTGASIASTDQGEIALEMHSMEGTARWVGFNPNGVQRILYGITFAQDELARRRRVHRPPATITELFERWRNVPQGPGSPEARAALRSTPRGPEWMD